MKFNPYEILGVDKGATESTMRRAYRRKAKAAHPDAGGDRAAWAALQKAYLLLTDDRARKRFDETGETELENDQTELTATAVIGEAFAAVCNQPLYVNMIVAMRRKISDDLAAIRRAIPLAREERVKWEKLQGRFKRKQAGGNLFEGFLKSKLRPIDLKIASFELGERASMRALEILEEYEFLAESPPSGYIATQPSGTLGSVFGRPPVGW